MKRIVPILLALTLCFSYLGSNKSILTKETSESNILVLTINQSSRDLIHGGGDDV